MPLSLSAFVIIVPAAWRLAYFLTSEMGPFDVVDRLRTLLHAQTSDNVQTKLFACVLCMSFWTALLLVGLWETDLSAIRLAVEVVSLWGWASALHLFANR